MRVERFAQGLTARTVLGRGPRLGSQNPYGGSQTSETPVHGICCPLPTSEGTWHTHDAQACTQTQHTHKDK